VHLLHPSFKKSEYDTMVISIKTKMRHNYRTTKNTEKEGRDGIRKNLTLEKIHKLVSSSISMSSLPTKAKKICNNDEGTGKKKIRGE